MDPIGIMQIALAVATGAASLSAAFVGLKVRTEVQQVRLDLLEKLDSQRKEADDRYTSTPTTDALNVRLTRLEHHLAHAQDQHFRLS